jgi:hypothetical protein
MLPPYWCPRVSLGLEGVVKILKVALSEFFVNNPREYGDYVRTVESTIPRGFRFKPRAGFIVAQGSDFSFGRVYRELSIDHVYPNPNIDSRVVVIRWYGWIVEVGSTKVMIMESYHMDILDRSIALAEVGVALSEPG